MKSITPCLWFDGQAEEAANFYVSIFKDSRIDAVVRAPEAVPGPTGSVMVVSFTLNGQSFSALNGGPMFTFTEAVSLMAECEDQAEIDRVWDALLSDGGAPSRCGWLKDRYGVSWQVAPASWLKTMTTGDPEGINRGMKALMGMVKLDLAEITAAYEGEA